MAATALQQEVRSTRTGGTPRQTAPKRGLVLEVRPAVADERGVVSVPPPVYDPQLLAVAGIGLAAVVGALLLCNRAKQ